MADKFAFVHSAKDYVYVIKFLKTQSYFNWSYYKSPQHFLER